MRSQFLSEGEPAPWFRIRSSVNPSFNFDTTAGRYNVLCFFGSAAQQQSQRILSEIEQIQQREGLFDLDNFIFTGVSVDPDDERLARVRQIHHGIRWFWDFERAVSRAYGADRSSTSDIAVSAPYFPHTIVLDERLRALKAFPFQDEPEIYVAKLAQYLRSLPRLAAPAMALPQAPVLVIPRIFEPSLCQKLIAYYESHGGQESGFMRDINGKTVHVIDHSHKRRTDCEIQDEQLKHACMVRIHDRLAPEIAKAFQFRANRMERYIVARYDSSTADHFRPHRDNTTLGTAHRRFAVSLVLNSGEFEGGYLRFPEYGRQLYAPPAGGAVVFSCSLLHEATAVTAGKRYVFLPFLYDDAAAKIREQNARFLEHAPQQGGA